MRSNKIEKSITKTELHETKSQRMFSTSCSTPSFNTTFHFACFLLHQVSTSNTFSLWFLATFFFIFTFSCFLAHLIFIYLFTFGYQSPYWISLVVLTRRISNHPHLPTHTHYLPFTNAIFSHHLRAVTKPQLALCFIPITLLPHHPPLGPLNHRIQHPTHPKRLIEPPFLSFPRH